MVVSFALMWLVMAKMIVPKITVFMNQRRSKIERLSDGGRRV